MRHRSWSFLLLTTTLLYSSISSSALAQTLNEKLIAEDPEVLAKQARQDGDIVRGAILFHQGNINCAKCHRPSAERDRMGPDLSRIDQEVTDAFLIDSILQPSKEIKEGFETVVVVTINGKVITGIKVSEDDQKLVIRDGQNVDKLISIQQNDIEEVSVGKKSNMPENLANELRNRQQFLDLLRYVIDVKERGPNANTGTTDATIARRELSPELNGLVLIQKLNCAACHSLGSIESPVAVKLAPQLSWSAKWLNPNYITSFIAEPHGVKPGTTMPSQLGHLDAATRTKSANAITHFLMTKIENQFEAQPIDDDAVSRGFEVFHSVGCVACHSPRNKVAVEQPLMDSIPLGDLGGKYNVEGLANFLEDPLAVRPSGHMPNMQLEHGEAVDISNYLLQAATDANARWSVDSELAVQGETLFSELNCASCHRGLTSEKTALVNERPLETLNSELGCLSDQSGDWPNFHLPKSERQSIQAALKKIPVDVSGELQIEVSMKMFNCIACHDRGDLGGVPADRNPHFQTSNLNLGDQGRIPPTLTGVGAKLKPKWMRDVLVNRRSIRPYMNTRMPQYGEENIGHLFKLFQENDRLPESVFAEFEDQKEMREKGLELAGNHGLNCVACHTYQYKISDTMPAVDLTEMTDRLKKDWFYQYMLTPQKFSPNTVMPSFWPSGQAIRKDVEGSPEDQIEALWQYLIDGRQARAPSGVVREPLEIVVTNEAKMLRRSYPEIGKRGIGVGYPGAVNLAFDAEQLRLGSIWKGKFVDPGGVWTGQGSGVVRPMGNAIHLEKGPDLDDATNPWVVDDGRPPNHQFKGYVLDESRRPTFLYVFDSVEVKDFFSEVIEETSEEQDSSSSTRLRRSVRLSTGERRDNLRFRIVSADKISTESDNSFSIGGQLKIRLVSDHVAQVVDVDDGQRLEILLNLEPGDTQELLIEYRWE